MALWHYQQIIVELRRNSVSYVLASYFLQLLGLALQPNRSTASSQAPSRSCSLIGRVDCTRGTNSLIAAAVAGCCNIKLFPAPIFVVHVQYLSVINLPSGTKER